MTSLHKFSLKNFCCTFVTVLIFVAITWNSKATGTSGIEFYSTLTSDTVPKPVAKPLNLFQPADTTGKDSILTDTLPPVQRIDTFSLKLSKDTLDAPVNYQAEDSAVLLVKEKKFLLYGKTRTTYKDVILTAPRVEMDQQTNIMTAYNAKDSLGNLIARAKFEQGTEGFESDTIRYNFKTQRGLTMNTYTRQQEMFVNAQVIKKVNANTTFARRVTMTTCEFDEPHFGFVGNKGKFITDKIAVTGPIHPEFEGVPVPVYLPFGVFPLERGRHSGLLPPHFTANEQFGLGLEGLGYYHVLNDYLDVTLRGNIYSYGGWSASLTPTYRKRYRYNGSLNFSLQHTKFNFKGDPDYRLIKTFSVHWTHSVDQRAKPGTSFSANVNASSTRHNEFMPNNPYRNFQNQQSSSIAYSKNWIGKPFNLTLSANHNQNNATRLVNLMLPDAGFTLTTIYPFQKKEVTGTPKWYEKIGIGYTGVARNQISFYDTAANSFDKILDTLLWGAQHRFPIMMSLPPLGKLIVSPSVSYEETWLTHKYERRWNSTTEKVDTVLDKKGLFIDRQMSFGVGMNTTVYGTVPFKNSRVVAIRHVVRPNVSFNYRPNLSKNNYDVIQVDTFGRMQALPQFQGNLFSGYGYGKFGGLSFGIDNNLEMKWRSKKDTAQAIKKIRLIDGFGINSAYNFLSDSLQLQPFNLYLRSTLFEKISLTAQALLDPYEKGTSGHSINRFVWQGDKFRPGRITSGSISMSTNFQSKPRDPSKARERQDVDGVVTTSDPNLMADQQRLQEYMQRNPAEFVDFNIPWSVNLSFSLQFSKRLQQDYSYKTEISSNLNFSNSFSLTPKWNFRTDGYFDVETRELTMFSMSISRDLHCWQMSINVTPIGNYRYFNITINPKSSILQDLKVNRTRYFYNY